MVSVAWLVILLYASIGHAQESDLYVSSETEYWNDAQEACRQKGLELVKMNTPEKQQMVKDHLTSIRSSETYWIGLKAMKYPPKSKNNWRWTDGTIGSSSMDDWHSKQPNGFEGHSSKGNEYCVIIKSSSNYRWLDTICDIGKFRYICERADVNDPPPSDLYLDPYSSYTWMEAQKKCHEMGQELVKIDSAEKQKRIEDFMNTYHGRMDEQVWIGLRATTLPPTDPNNFKWTDGSGATYSNWYGDDPVWTFGDIKEDETFCTFIYGGYRWKWRDHWCSFTRSSFICEKPVVDPPVISEMSPDRMIFLEKESFELPCVASAQPQPEYYWKVNNEVFDPISHSGRVDFKSGVGTLIFTKAEKEDEGIYQCFVENPGGVATSIQTDLRFGFLEPFVSKEVVNHSPELGSGLTLRCDAPKSYPEPEYNWVTIEEYVAIIPIKISERVSIDPEGGLHLAHVISEDKQDGRQYACAVYNDFTRNNRIGNFQTVNPQGEVVRPSQTSIIWQSPSQQVALLGETWNIMCIFSGNPTPNVQWSRHGKPMPETSRVESYDRELVIDNVQFEDAGTYECQGDNDEGTTVKKSFQLTVEERPSWTKAPESVDVPEGATVVFHCAASGTPQPLISWYINHTPVSEMPPDPRRILSNNKLTLMNVTDDQVIQCNASNRHGYVLKNAALNINSEAADIKVPPQARLEVNLGGTVELRCAVSGVPQPVVQWKKAYEITTGSRFEVMDSGSLKITNVSLLDTGMYECTATNTQGSESARGSIIVIDESGIY